MAQTLLIKSAELVVVPDGSERDVRTILHTLPNNKGWVFGLFSVEHKNALGRERVAHILSSHLEHLAADLADEANVARRFEQTLNRVNRDLSKAAKELSLNIERFNAVIGVISRNQVFLSGTGHLKALFLHKTSERRYVIYELDDQFKSDTESDNPWDKSLITVLDGEIHPSDILYLATPISKLALSLNELQDILVTLPPAGALQRICQYLGPNEHFGALAFHAQEEEKSGVIRKANPINSLQELEHTKDRTATVLGEQQPDLAYSLKDVGKKVSQKLTNPGVRSFQASAKRLLAIIIRVGSVGLAAVAGLISKGMKQLQAAWKNRQQTKTGQALNSRPTAARSLPRFSKTQLIAGLGFIILLIITIFIIVHPKKTSHKQEQAAFEAQTQSIEDKLLTAEASLIYNNTSEANKNLTEASTALAELPQPSEEQQAKVQQLTDKLNELLARVRGVTLIQPTVLADLSDVADGGSILSATGSVNGTIAITNNFNIYKLNALKRTWEKQPVTTPPLSRIVTATAEGDNVLFVDSTQQLARLDLANSTLTIPSSGTNNMSSLEDVIVYNNNLYALTANDQQIVKMRPQAPNYEAGTVWITSHNTDLSTARSLAIDSDIYVLLANSVVKFSAGQEQSWQLGQLEPPLSQPIKIWSALESKYVYVLEPAEKRIVVINKNNGSVQAQYVADAFSQAVNMVIDEATSKIIVITTTQALEFTPTHLVN